MYKIRYLAHRVLHALRDLQGHCDGNRQRQSWVTEPSAQVSLHTFRAANILSNDIREFIETLDQIGANDVRMLFEGNPDGGFVLEQREHLFVVQVVGANSFERARKFCLMVEATIDHAHRAVMDSRHLVTVADLIAHLVELAGIGLRTGSVTRKFRLIPLLCNAGFIVGYCAGCESRAIGFTGKPCGVGVASCESGSVCVNHCASSIVLVVGIEKGRAIIPQ